MLKFGSIFRYLQKVADTSKFRNKFRIKNNAAKHCPPVERTTRSIFQNMKPTYSLIHIQTKSESRAHRSQPLEVYLHLFKQSSFTANVQRNRLYFDTVPPWTKHKNTHQNDLLGLAEDEDLAFAKSTKSLKSASSDFSCFFGVDELRDRLFVCPTKLS